MSISQKSLFQQATEAFHSGNPDLAKQLCIKQLKTDPLHSECHHLVALVNSGKGAYKAAEKHFLSAIKIDNSKPEFFKNLADVYLNTLQYNKAIENYKRAIQIKPDYFQAHANLGNVYLKNQQPDIAIDCFKNAIQFRPDIAALHDNLGNAFKAAGKISDSIASHLNAIELSPQLISAYINLAHVYRNQEKTTKAIEVLQQALRFSPDSADVHFSLGESFSLQHQFKQALHHYQKAKSYPQFSRLALFRELTTLNKLKAYTQARELLLPYADIRHSDPDIALHYSYLSNNKKEIFDCIHDLESILKKQELDAIQQQRLLFRLGDMHDELGEYDRAFKYYQSANRSSTSSWNAAAFQVFIGDLLTNCGQELIEQVPTASNESQLPAFIVGMPRSGKSLLEQLLATHPKILGAGELADIGARLNLKSDFNSANYADKLSRLTRDKVQRIADEYINECRKLALEKTTRVINTTPLNFIHLGLISRLFPQAKIIHIHRNPLDNSLACFSKRFANQQTYAFTHRLEDIGSFYQQHLILVEHWQKNSPIQIIQVSYEQLVSDTGNTLDNIFDFLQVDAGYDYLQANLSATSNLAVDREFDSMISDRYIGIWRHYKKHLQPLIDIFARDK